VWVGPGRWLTAGGVVRMDPVLIGGDGSMSACRKLARVAGVMMEQLRLGLGASALGGFVKLEALAYGELFLAN
jgi:hypothetical protein